MYKLVIVFIILFNLLNCGSINYSSTSSNQTGFQEKDSINMLTNYEVEVLISLLKNLPKDINLKDSKLAFVTGSSGSKLISKDYFFNNYIYPWVNDKETPQVFLITLNNDEKKKSGGYDALVLAWVKVFTNKTKRNIISSLSEHNQF